MHKIIYARVLVFLLYHTSCVLLLLAFVIIWSLPLCDIVFDFQMLESSLPYIGFADGASCSTQNLASAAWEIYTPTNELSPYEVCVSAVQPTIL